MAAFIPFRTPFPHLRHTPLVISIPSSLSPQYVWTSRSARRCVVTSSVSGSMNNVDGGKVKVKVTSKELSDDEERLQNDKPFMLREFGKVAAAATVIGIVLFCFDILVSLVALSLGAIYATAVLFDLRFFTNFVHRSFSLANRLRSLAFSRVQSLWTAMRSRISKKLTTLLSTTQL